MRQRRPRLFMLALTVAIYALIALLSWSGGMSLQVRELAPFVLSVALATGVISYLSGRGNMFQLQAVVDCIGCGVLLTVPIVASTYLAMSVGMPLADETLAAADAFIGMDWKTVMEFVDANPVLATIFNLAYGSFSYQLLLWPIVLACMGRQARAYQTVASYAVLCMLSSLISVWWPAVGTYVFYAYDSITLQNIDTKFAYFFLQQFNAVRSDPEFVWSMMNSAGILTFPSVHAAVAVLCAWAAWDVRGLRYPAVMLNIAMALSTVPVGSHYLVDVVAGMGVAAISIAFVGWLTNEVALKRDPAFAA